MALLFISHHDQRTTQSHPSGKEQTRPPSYPAQHSVLANDPFLPRNHSFRPQDTSFSPHPGLLSRFEQKAALGASFLRKHWMEVSCLHRLREWRLCFESPDGCFLSVGERPSTLPCLVPEVLCAYGRKGICPIVYMSVEGWAGRGREVRKWLLAADLVN